MKKALAERIGVVAMFAMVLVVFSIAERDTKKLIKEHSSTVQKTDTKPLPLASTKQPTGPIFPSR